MKLVSSLRSGISLRLLVSLAVTGAIVTPSLLLGRASAVSLDIACSPPVVRPGEQITCDLTLAIPDPAVTPVESLQISVSGASPLQATFGLSGTIISGDAPVQQITLISSGTPGGYAYGYGLVGVPFKYQVVINTAGLAIGDYAAKFILNTGDPAKPSFESASVSFSIIPPGVSAVSGQALLQGRSQLNHAGTQITLILAGDIIQPVIITPADGSFSFALGVGDYLLQATHPGWLSESRAFAVDGVTAVVTLGTIELAAGDADGDNDVDSRDLQLFQRALGGPPQPDTFTDVNDDGVVDILDTTYGGRNLGQTGQ